MLKKQPSKPIFKTQFHICQKRKMNYTHFHLNFTSFPLTEIIVKKETLIQKERNMRVSFAVLPFFLPCVYASFHSLQQRHKQLIISNRTRVPTIMASKATVTFREDWLTTTIDEFYLRELKFCFIFSAIIWKYIENV